MDVMKRRERQPNFTSPARLEVLPRSQAVIELLRRFQGGYQSRLLQEEFGGSMTCFFQGLAALLGQTNCYRLHVGPLHKMADLVCGLMSA